LSGIEPEHRNGQVDRAVPIPEVPSAQEHWDELLKNIDDNHPSALSDAALFNWKDITSLQQAVKQLTLKSKDKKIDVFFYAHITAMVGTLNLYLDPDMSYGWREASFVVAKSSGNGVSHAQKIRTWIHCYLLNKTLPLHHYGQFHSSVLEDEDFAHELKVHLLEVLKSGYLHVQDVADFVGKPETQEFLGGCKASVSLHTAQQWLKQMDWRNSRRQNGMYVDGHEHEDVVKY
jgi:hypothetical protein